MSDNPTEPVTEKELKEHEESDVETDIVIVDAIAAIAVKTDELETRLAALEENAKKEPEPKELEPEPKEPEPVKDDGPPEAEIVKSDERKRGGYRRL